MILREKLREILNKMNDFGICSLCAMVYTCVLEYPNSYCEAGRILKRFLRFKLGLRPESETFTLEELKDPCCDCAFLDWCDNNGHACPARDLLYDLTSSIKDPNSPEFWRN